MKIYAFTFPTAAPKPTAANGGARKSAGKLNDSPRGFLFGHPGDQDRTWLLLSSYVQSGSVAVTSPIASDAENYKEAFLDEQAKELGISRSQLTSGISRWIESAKSAYEKGLGSLFRGDYVAARQYFSDALETPEPRERATTADKQVCLARAEFELGHHDAAQRYLQQALAGKEHSAASEFLKRDLLIVEHSPVNQSGEKSTLPVQKDVAPVAQKIQADSHTAPPTANDGAGGKSEGKTSKEDLPVEQSQFHPAAERSPDQPASNTLAPAQELSSGTETASNTANHKKKRTPHRKKTSSSAESGTTSLPQ